MSSTWAMGCWLWLVWEEGRRWSLWSPVEVGRRYGQQRGGLVAAKGFHRYKWPQ